MNKKFKMILSALLTLVLGFVLIACTDVEDDTPPETPVTYTVTFNSNGGSAVASQTVEEGKKATKPADPTRLDYTFGEWQLSGVKFEFDTPITADITLKATWSLSATVTLRLNVTLPEGTPAGDIYISGVLNHPDADEDWSGADIKATRDGLTAFVELVYSRDDLPVTIQYKWTRGSWDSVEKDADGEELDNRTVIITASVVVNDVVESWADGGIVPDPDAELVEVTFNVTLPANTPAEDDIYLAGAFNSLNEEYPDWNPGGLKLTRDGLTATITLELLDGGALQYKFTRGDWANAEVKEDGSEQPNRTGVVSEGLVINIVIGDWEDLFEVEPVDPEEATLKYTGGTTNMVGGANNAAVVNLDPEVFTVSSTARQLPDNLHIGLNGGGNIRVYALRGSESKSTLTVEIAEGFVITQVEFKFGASTYAPLGTLMLGDNAHSLDAADLTGVVKLYEDLSINGFSIRAIQDEAFIDNNAQIIINEIVIYYIEGEATSKFVPIPKLDVVFDLGYEDKTILTQYEAGDIMALPADPVRAGYDFVGWFTDLEGTVPYVLAEDTPASEALTIYAKWHRDSDEVLLGLAADALDINPKMFNADGQIELPLEGLHGSTITWASSDIAAIDPMTGAVTLPEEAGNHVITLTAILSLGEEVPVTKEISITLVVTEDGTPEPILDKTIDFGTANKTGYGAGTLTANEIEFTKDRVQFNTQSNANSNKTVGAVLAPINTAQTAFMTFAYAGVTKLEFDVITWATGTTVRPTATFTVRFSTDGGETWLDSDNLIGMVTKTEVSLVTVLAPEGVTHIQFYYNDVDAASGNTSQAIVVDNVKLYK